MIYKEIQSEKVPALGLGTYQLTGRDCARAVEQALSIGYRHIDTAQMYGNENEVGQAMQSSGVERGEIFLTTKIWPSDFAHDRAIEKTHDSLKKLRTEYVDLLLMHWPSSSIPHQETLEAMRELQDEGKVRHVGVSNFSPRQVEDAARHATIFCNQVEYNAGRRQDAILEQAQEMDYLLAAYKPIARGAILNNATLEEIGESHGKSTAQVALRWLTQQEKVCAIPKATSDAHLKSNFEVFDFELTDDEMKRIGGLA